MLMLIWLVGNHGISTLQNGNGTLGRNNTSSLYFFCHFANHFQI